MRNIILLLLLFVNLPFIGLSQTVIKMKSEGGVSLIPCKINGLKLNFIFDTGASDVSISLTEASFMLKNGYLDKSDIIGTSNYLDANGNINEGININLREIEIGELKIKNVKASIVKNLKAPLLLGQSALSKLGKFQIDLDSNTLTIINEKGTYNYFKDSKNNDQVVFNDTTKVTIDPNNESEYFEQGVLKYNLDDYQGAIIEFSKVIEINSTNDQAYYSRGLSKAGLEDDKGAIEDYNKAIEINSRFEKAYYRRAISKYSLNNYQGAIKDFSAALNINPKDVDAYYWRGRSKDNLNDDKGAVADYNAIIKIDPKYLNAFVSRGVSKDNLKDYNGAMLDYNKAIQLDPKNSLPYVNRGITKYHLKDYRGALTDYNKAIQLDPTDFAAFHNRGNAKGKLKDYNGAIEDYNKAIEINPENGSTYRERGLVKDKLQDYEGAIADYTKAKEINPKDIFSSIHKKFSEKALEEQQKEKAWIYVGSTTEGSAKFFLNSLYVSKDGSVIKVWTKIESKKESIYKNGKALNYINVTSLYLNEFDCSDRMSKINSVIYYDSKGTVIKSSDEETNWANIIPDTIGESILRKVCELFN